MAREQRVTLSQSRFDSGYEEVTTPNSRSARLLFNRGCGPVPEFTEPWKNPKIALAIDPYERNGIDWDLLATDTRVVAIIHRATIGDRADRKYAERRDEAKKRGYKWGAYHFGRPGDPIKQADFFLETVKPGKDDLIALDLESTDAKDQ